jgi:predicted Zn-dependent protease
MSKTWPISASVIKSLFFVVLLGAVAGCSTNPATGQQQFTALMSPAQEQRIGTQEHGKIMSSYGTIENGAVSSYVSEVGRKLVPGTERGDVNYQFFVLDDPMVNAFALPGGYIYVTRGLLAQANSEAELAAVLGHEIGHITGRHSAERYSRGLLTSLGAVVLSAALDDPSATRALGLGSELFMRSYSRSQEHEADMLGLRYLHRSQYHPDSMASFLKSLEANTALQKSIDGQKGRIPGWFSTHPMTADRISQTNALASEYPKQGHVGRDGYLNVINGLVYGDSIKQGLVRGQSFYHPRLDFMFTVPGGFKIVNQPSQVVALDQKGGAAIIFDSVSNKQNVDPLTYLTKMWMKGEKINDAELITINDKAAATASFEGVVDRRQVTIRLVSIAFKPGVIYRFQMAIPKNADRKLIDSLKSTTYSLRPMTSREKKDIQPYRIRLVTARQGDTIESLARKMPFPSHNIERFMVLNALSPSEELITGRTYKTVGY